MLYEATKALSPGEKKLPPSPVYAPPQWPPLSCTSLNSTFVTWPFTKRRPGCCSDMTQSPPGRTRALSGSGPAPGGGPPHRKRAAGRRRDAPFSESATNAALESTGRCGSVHPVDELPGVQGEVRLPRPGGSVAWTFPSVPTRAIRALPAPTTQRFPSASRATPATNPSLDGLRKHRLSASGAPTPRPRLQSLPAKSAWPQTSSATVSVVNGER